MLPQRRRGANSPRRVLLVGWDAADWQMIHPLIERGMMPTLAALMRSGAWGNLATVRPILSPILWNTIATGKRAAQHGIYGFTEPAPNGQSIQPARSTSRKCKALWNILTQCGLRSNVIGWYASHPAEPISGVMVSNQFDTSPVEDHTTWRPDVGCIHPAELAAELAELRVHPQEIDPGAILPFIPSAATLLNNPEHRLGKLQHLLAQTATIHAVATHLLTSTEWDFTAVYYEGIDRFGHEFMEFHPPKMEQVSEADFVAYRDCMTGIYRFHDMLLETLLKLAGEETTVIVMSDHGYYNNHLRPDPRPGKAGPTDWHRPFGMFAAQGPGIVPGSRVYGGSLLDMAPTILDLLGYPAGLDMPGRVLAEVLVGPNHPSRIASWEDVPGADGRHAPDARIDPTESYAALAQLVALGYIAAPSEEAANTVRQTIAGNQYSLAQSQADAGRFAEAAELIRGLDAEFRDEVPAQLLLATCLMGQGDSAGATTVLTALRAGGCQEPRMHMMLGVLAFSAGDAEAALEHLRVVEATEPRLPGLHNKLGEVYLQQRRFDLAQTAFRKALEIEADNAVALTGLARAEFELGRPEPALELALEAAELVHHFPRLHFLIGEVFIALGDKSSALEALELCIHQAPRFKAAQTLLADLYEELGRPDDARIAKLRGQGLLT